MDERVHEGLDVLGGRDSGDPPGGEIPRRNLEHLYSRARDLKVRELIAGRRLDRYYWK